MCVDQVTLSPKEESTAWNRTEKDSKDSHTPLEGKALKGTSVWNESKSGCDKRGKD